MPTTSAPSPPSVRHPWPAARIGRRLDDTYPRTRRFPVLAAEGTARAGSAYRPDPRAEADHGAGDAARGGTGRAPDGSGETGTRTETRSESGTDAAWEAGALHAAIDALEQVALDELDREQLRSLLVAVTGPLRRLEAQRTRLAGALRLREAPARDPLSGTPPRSCQDFLTDQLGLTPAEARDLTSTASRLPEAPATDDAYRRGDITSRHASVIASHLPRIAPDQRAAAESELLEAARRVDPVALGRRARQLVAASDPDELRLLERRRAIRRRFSYHRAEDGGLRFSGQLYGTEAERAQTAFDAFTERPTAEDTRSHDQRRADGLVALANAALRAGEAATQHRVRPHVLVLVQAEELDRARRSGQGVATLGSGEPVTFADAAGELADCELTRIVLDAEGAPIAASRPTRTIPVALWRALQARDRGCTWPGCSAPISWCDIAHLHDPHAAGGCPSPHNTALLCRRHHRGFDAGGWRAEVDGGRVTYHRAPERPPVQTLIHRQREARRRRLPPREPPPPLEPADREASPLGAEP